MDQNLTPMQQMIYTGQFGYNGPQQPMYPMYQQPQPYYNQQQFYNQQPYYNNQQQQSPYVFQPIPQQYQQPTYQNPYANVNFNPYNGPMMYNNMPMYNTGSVYQPALNPYAYNNAGGMYQGPSMYVHNPYLNLQDPVQMQRIQMMHRAKIEADKMMYRIAAKAIGKTINEEWLEMKFNPKPVQPQQKYKSYEEMVDEQRWRRWQQYAYWVHNPQAYISDHQIALHHVACMSEEWHKAFDHHSLFEFLNNDMWQIQRNEWVRKNIKMNTGRNLSGTYNSKEYNELLAMHRSTNPYVDQLLNVSRYDNNADDVPIGMEAAINKQQRIANILDGKVPDFISSPEVQEHRARYTAALMEEVYKKKGASP